MGDRPHFRPLRDCHVGCELFDVYARPEKWHDVLLSPRHFVRPARYLVYQRKGDAASTKSMLRHKEHDILQRKRPLRCSTTRRKPYLDTKALISAAGPLR